MKKLTKGMTATVAMAASLTMLLAGCGGGGSTPANAANGTATGNQPQNGGTVTIGQATKYNQLFIPDMDGSLYTANIVAAAYDPLLTIDKNLNFISDLAKTWSWSSDKKTLTITLADATWSDGKPITSDDVLFTLNYLGSASYNGPLQGEYGYLVQPIVGSDKVVKNDTTSFADVGGFTKVDDKTFSLTFATADAAVLWSDISAIQPIPQHALTGTVLKNWTTLAFDQKPTVVSGPFTFDTVNGEDSVIMKANPTYFRGKPHLDQLIWKTVSADVAPGLLANGNIDIMLNGLKPNDVDKLKQISNINIKTEPDMGYQYMGMKLYQKEFKDVRVRQALMYGINRQALVTGLLKGYGEVLNGPLPSVSWAAASTADGMTDYAYDPTKAGQLLDAAGWTKGSDGWRIDPVTGKTANISLDYPLGNTVRMASAVAIKQDLAKIGLKIDLHSPMDFNSLSKKIENDDKSVYLWLMGWGLAADPDPRGIWGSNDAFNFPRWKDPTNESLIKATYNTAAFDKTVRKQALIKWQVYVNQQVPYIFLYQDDLIFAVNKRVQIPTDDWNVFGPFNFQDWWVKQ